MASIRVASETRDGVVSASFPIWLSNLECSGTESNIADCPHRGWGSHDCSHDQDAAVVCSNDTPSNSTAIELTEQGRIRVSFNGVWGRVGVDQWDIRDANVVCKQLGYSGAQGLKIFDVSDSEPLWMNNVHCTGRENTLWACPFSGWGHAHTTGHDAGVSCENYDSSSRHGNYDVRLVGGASASEGTVEIFYGEEWGSVCDSHWTQTEADVVCRQLGYDAATGYYSNSNYGGGNGKVIMDAVRCKGQEDRLVDCQFSGWGYVNSLCVGHNNDAGVTCGGMAVS